jgi:hypothetical protein
MTQLLQRLLRCDRAASAAEFSLVLPLMLILLFGTIDVGRFLWAMNQAEKATQMGARFAVVTTPVSPGLVEADFAGGEIAAGDLIPADALGALSCTASACTCSGTCPVSDLSVNGAAFNAIVARMQVFKPDIEAENVRVTYRGSGFGFAGSPVSGGGGGGGGGAAESLETSPLVTVSIMDLPFTSLFFFNLTLPAFSTTLPAEDASGAFSN